MLKKHLISLISILLVFSFSLSAFAATFSDVGEGYAWAETAIEEMSANGIISGYPDGSFKPAAGITKVQAMLLISRILGYNQGVYSPYIDFITEYANTSELGLAYEDEIAFLIYKGVFTSEEIEEASYSMNEPLLRYEVAEYLTRAMGKYDEVAYSDSAETGYADEELIPEDYRGFVEYVKAENLMLGTDETTFSPENQVTRAQMAVLLHRVMEKLSLDICDATFISYDAKKKDVTVKIGKDEFVYDTEDALFYVNGAVGAETQFDKSEPVVLVFENEILTKIEKITDPSEPVIDYKKEVKTIKARISEINLSDRYINVIESESTDGKSTRYYFRDDCMAIVDGNERTLSALRTKDHVELSLNVNDEILKVTIIDVSDEFAGGKILSVSTKNGLIIKVEKADGEVVEYTTADTVAVKRNSQSASLSDLLSGDTIVKCVLTYNRISALEVRSIVSSTSGEITEIVISQESSMVIDGKGGETRYAISDDIKITVDGEASDVYGLRLGMNASVTLDSNTITKITVTSVSDSGSMTGVVQVINTAYGFVNIRLADGSEKQVFVKSGTYIYDDATKRTKQLSNIKEGDTLIVIGKNVNGAFQATTIILVAE